MSGGPFNNLNGKSWAQEMRNELNAKAAARTPEQVAANNAARNALNRELATIRAAKNAAPVAMRNFGSLANAAPRRVTPMVPRRVNGPKPRPGKVMKECRTSNVTHDLEGKGACKFVHKDEPEYAMLRPEQKRTGGKSTRKSSRKASSRKGGFALSVGRNIHVPASPPPLSKVNTYTSWPGGVDPTAPLYNQKTMIGGKKTRRNRK